jgi:hypothetical protein
VSRLPGLAHPDGWATGIGSQRDNRRDATTHQRHTKRTTRATTRDAGKYIVLAPALVVKEQAAELDPIPLPATGPSAHSPSPISGQNILPSREYHKNV